MARENQKKIKRKNLKVKDLLEVHDEHKNNNEEWSFLMTMYEGIRNIIKKRLVEKHERESEIAYQRRLEELYGFGYTKSVIEVLNHFLFKKKAIQTLGSLHDDKLWKLFIKDANLLGDSYEKTIMDATNYSSILGHVGILIDKANANFITKAEQVKSKVYPYIAVYFPKAILDWKWAKDEYHRPYLAYLKLKDDGDQYRLWFPDHWEIWELPEDEDGQKTDSNEEAEAVFINSNTYDIGKIPFIWHYNLKSRKISIGNSDVHEVSRIDLSIIRNASQIEEIINYAAFPMMRKPKRDASPVTGQQPQMEDEVGVEVILEFDPEHPESKPDWLDATVAEPVSVTLQWIEKKVGEIYRASNIGGMAAMEPTSNPQSGVAKRVDFQLLNSKMVNKAINLENTEIKILELFLRWEKMWDQYKEKVKITREKTFDIEDIAGELENALTSQMVVQSKSFNSHIQKAVARKMLPALNEKEIKEIDDEIDENIENEQNFNQGSTFIEDIDTNIEDDSQQNKDLIQNGLKRGNNQ